MAYSTYLIVRQILMSIIAFMGLHMLFVSISRQLHNSFYRHSLRIMGLAFLLVPISCFIYTKDNQLDLKPYISTAISLSSYFATFILMIVSFLILLGKKFSKLLLGAIATATILYPMPLWLAIAFGSDDLISTITSASYFFFVIIIVLLVVSVLYKHHLVLKEIENCYTDDILICVRWFSKSIYMLVGLALVCVVAPIFFVYPRWLRLVFMVYGVLCFFHIYYGFRRLLMNLTEYFLLRNAPQQNPAAVERELNTPDVTLSVKITDSIAAQVESWLQQKRYLCKGVTISDVAKEFNTHRTYLSRYVNSVYSCSFRKWVTLLRIEEAKKLLLSDVELPISNIADSVGSASIESFTHIFTRVEGVSPTKWRDDNIN